MRSDTSRPPAANGYKFFYIVCVTLLAFVGAQLTTPRSVGAADMIKLKLATAWAQPEMNNIKLMEFINRLNKESKSVQIEFKGGPESVPPFQGMDYLRRGVIDLWHTTPAYYAGSIPAAMTDYLMVATPAAMRASGYWDLFDKIHREKMGVTALGQLVRGDPFALYLNKRIEKADLSGLKIRTTPLYTPILRALGASTVTLPIGDTYSSLQRGLVDGLCYSYGPGFNANKLDEVVKYVVHPLIPFEASATLLANAKVWDSLPENVKKEISDLLIKMEPNVYKFYKTESIKVMDALIHEGRIDVINLPPDQAKKFLSVARDAIWEDLGKKAGAYTKQLRDLAVKAERLSGGQ